MAICYRSSGKLIETLSSCVRLGKLFNFSVSVSSSAKWDDKNFYFMGQLWRLDEGSHVQNVEPCLAHCRCSINVFPAILIPSSFLLFSSFNSVLGLYTCVFSFSRVSSESRVVQYFPHSTDAEWLREVIWFSQDTKLTCELDLELGMLWLQTWSSFCYWWHPCPSSVLIFNMHSF